MNQTICCHGPVLACLLTVCLVGLVHAHGPADGHAHFNPQPATWRFVPVYTLPGNAANALGPRLPAAQTPTVRLASDVVPMSLYGRAMTDRVTRLTPTASDGTKADLPRDAFTAEMWVHHHVNRPVSVLLMARGASDVTPPWSMDFHVPDEGKSLLIQSSFVNAEGRTAEQVVTVPKYGGFKERFHHVVATYDGTVTRLYHNGELRSQSKLEGPLAWSSLAGTPFVEAAAYLENEPFMQMGNLLREASVVPGVWDEPTIARRFAELCARVEAGTREPGLFHFTAGPMLHMATQNSMNLSVETDRDVTVEVAYGTSLDAMRSRLAVDEPGTIHRVTLTGLQPQTPYFYRVTATDRSAATIDSGVLTFKTAVADDAAYTFTVLGDSEARPHVNFAMSRLVWDTRPDFVMITGDLTDGGKQPSKYEWNLEYFHGMGPLLSRIPSFAVPGNGESDLYWYNRYHRYPGNEADPKRGYYAFRYGNAEFFMVDSNQRGDGSLAPGGEQFRWLDESLAASQARWKFVAHHHPTYSSDENDYGNTWTGPSTLSDPEMMHLPALYEKHGVDLVFYGHLHSYERSWPIRDGAVSDVGGVRYVQTGGAGGNLEDFAPGRTWFKGSSMTGHHFCQVDVHAGTLIFRMFDAQGDLRDTFTLHKDADAPGQRARLAAE